MKQSKWPVALGWAIALGLFWELAAFCLAEVWHDPMAAAKLPYLHVVVQTLMANLSSLVKAAGVTLSKAALGFAIGGAVGYLLAVTMSLSRTIERVAFPYLIVSQMIPVLGLAPIIFNLVRDMDASRVIIAAYITFFPVAANTLSGFRSVDVEKRQLMHSYAASLGVSYRKLMVPFSLSYLFAGLKIAAPMSVTASILVDMLGSRNGIGVKLLYSLYGGDDKLFWASVLVSAAMGIFSFLIVVALEAALVPWQRIARAHAGRE